MLIDKKTTIVQNQSYTDIDSLPVVYRFENLTVLYYSKFWMRWSICLDLTVWLANQSTVSKITLWILLKLLEIDSVS